MDTLIAEEVEKLFKQGLRLTLISKTLGISLNRVTDYLKSKNLKRNPVEQGKIIRKRRLANLPIEKFRQYYFEDKLTLEEITKKLNMGYSQLKRRIEELGWTRVQSYNKSSEKILAITKEQIEEIYIKQNKSSHECQDILNISRKSWKRLIKKYGIIKNPYTIQQNKKEKTIKNLQQKYGKNITNAVNIPGVRDKIKQTCLKKYGCDNYASTESWKIKHSATRKKNHTWNTSKFEQQVKQILINKFGSNDIVEQYNDTRYSNPKTNKCFDCDFYIKSLDLFIEIQGSAFHGTQPWDPTNPLCQDRLNTLLKRNNSYSNQIIDIWTDKDVVKRNIAKQNRLNFKEFFTWKEFNNWFKTLD